jgi:hypothetical protein
MKDDNFTQYQRALSTCTVHQLKIISALIPALIEAERARAILLAQQYQSDDANWLRSLRRDHDAEIEKQERE